MVPGPSQTTIMLNPYVYYLCINDRSVSHESKHNTCIKSGCVGGETSDDHHHYRRYHHHQFHSLRTFFCSHTYMYM